MMSKWTSEQAWQWYRSYPWLRGCNYIGSDCANRRDQWQSYGAEAHLATADRELALARETGFNTVRLIADFDVWYQEPESFMDILERYLTICSKNGQYVMLVLSSEAELPNGDVRAFVPKKLGEQTYALGYHQGRSPKVLAVNEDKSRIYHPLESPVLRESCLTMVRQIVEKYREDPRIICWNIYNEPGIFLKERAIPVLEELFETVRALHPVQPLTAELFSGLPEGRPLEPERVALELSDVISFHCYLPFREFCRQIDYLRQYDRPLLCTEWLNRLNGSGIREIFPLLYAEDIGSWCWGFVVGKTQTNEPWYGLWKEYAAGRCQDLDFTKWLHDLYRPSLLPYDPRETELIRRYAEIADRKRQ